MRITFWLINTLSWLFLCFSNFMLQLLAKPDPDIGIEALYNSFFLLFGLLISALARLVIHRIELPQQKVGTIILLSIPIISVSALFQTLLLLMAVSFVHFLFSLPQPSSFFLLFIRNFASMGFIYSIWLLGYLAVNYFQRIRQVEIDKLRLQSALNEARLQGLIGQVNPHYMFNALNNIRALMLEDVERSREMIGRLAATLRYSLNSQKASKVTLAEELEVVAHYIQLSKIQFEERLDYQQSIEPGLENYLLPPMLLQMLIENALKHGINALPEGGTLQLNIQKKEKQLAIIITNDYLPNYTPPENSTKIGLQNLQERLELLYDSKANFHIYKDDTTFKVSIQLPLETQIAN